MSASATNPETSPSGLKEEDLSMLKSSFISADIVSAAKIRRVGDDEGAELVDRQTRRGVNHAGLVFPYFLPDRDDSARQYRLRRDKPEHERRKDGTVREKGKYLSRPGSPNLLYFPPGLSMSDLKDVSLPIVITEGEKKALALSRLASEGTDKPRFAAVGICGVWNWRGKTVSSAGESSEVKGPIADLDLLRSGGRKITILFDTNVVTNNNVALAREGLGRELSRRGAKVAYAELPENCSVNGIDDYLGMVERESGATAAIDAGLLILAQAREVGPKVSQASRLVDVDEDLELFHNAEGEYFASFRVGDHLETHQTRSKMFREHLSRQYFERTGRVPSSQAMQDALQVLNGKARFEGKKRKVHLRLASFDDRIYLDLCNDTWEVVEVTKQGFSIIAAEDCPVRFIRTSHMLQLPRPEKAGSINDLREFLNVDGDGDDGDDSFILLLSWLVNSFRPDYPFPILIIAGEQGTAKSTTAKLIRSLIDPSVTPHRGCPRTEQDLMIAANRSWVCSFDNVSNIPDWLSDALCRLSTGGGIGGRTLYANDEETILKAQRPIILNGIGNIAGRSDLIDRALILNLKVIPRTERRTEREIQVAFDAKAGLILAALLTAVSTALNRLDEVHFDELPRMADFAQWAAAAEPALGFAPGSFIRAYSQSRQRMHGIVLEGSAIGEVLADYCFRRNAFKSDILIKDLLHELTALAGTSAQVNKDFPKTSKKLRNDLERIAPNLREIGIKVTFLGKAGIYARRGASLRLEYTPIETSPTSLTSMDTVGPCSSLACGTAVGDVSEVDLITVVTGTSQSIAECSVDAKPLPVETAESQSISGGNPEVCPDCKEGDLSYFSNAVTGCELCGYRVPVDRILGSSTSKAHLCKSASVFPTLDSR